MRDVSAASSTVTDGRARFFPNLHFLRGLAAVIVASGHFFLDTPLHDEVGALSQSHVWVDFFFMQSGFLLLSLYGGVFSKAVSRPALSDFYLRRLARIYPLHLVVLLLFVSTQLWLEKQQIYFNDQPFEYSIVENAGAGGLLSSLLLINGWGLHTGYVWNAVSWSISAEFAAYLLFPFLAAPIISASAGQRLTLLAACAGIAFWLLDVTTLSPTFQLGVPRCIVAFAAGALLARVPLQLSAKTAHTGCALLLLSILLVQQAAAPVILSWILMLVLTWVAGGASQEKQTGRWLGRISYSVYMLHTPIFAACFVAASAMSGSSPYSAPPTTTGGLGLYVVAMSLVLLASTASFAVIEAPCRRLIVQHVVRRGVGKTGAHAS